VVAVSGDPGKLTLLPTGAGDSRVLTDGKTDAFNPRWTPDGKSIVYTSAEPGHRWRSYLVDPQGGTPRPVTPEGITGSLVTADGKFLLAADAKRKIALYPLAGGDAQKAGFELGPDEGPIRFLSDGKSLLLRTRSALPLQVSRLDLVTGKRQPWRQIAPADPAGVQRIVTLQFSPDGKSYVYSLGRTLSDLYVVDGLK
jgi:Tol biopolymer transport system component